MEDRIIHLVLYAHLDTQWRWEFPTTIARYLRSTLTENFARFAAHPDYEFNFTGARRYAMMKEYYPELFGRLCDLISAGRWHLAGTCLDETDALVPSVESMVRNAEVLSRPLAYELQHERPAQFPAWNMDWSDRKKKPAYRIKGAGTVTVLERGPIRAGLRVVTRFGDSTFTREIRLTADSDLVEITERISWRESGYSLKIAVCTPGAEPTVTTNWETCRIEHPVNTPATYEFPSRFWTDLGSPDGSVSIIEDSKYGYDRPDVQTLRMTLPFTPDLRPLSPFRDQGSNDRGDRVRVRIAPNGLCSLVVRLAQPRSFRAAR